MTAGRVIWGLIILVLGVLLLAANFGWIDWGFVLSRWQLWPLILVLIGIGLLFRGRNQALGAVVMVVVVLLGIGLAWVMYAGESPLPHRLTYQLGGLHRLLLNDYYVERLYDATIVRFVRWLADWLAGVFDRGVVDGAVSGVARLVRLLSLGFGALETGYVRNYVLAFLLGAVLILAYLVRSGVTP
jgi:NADH-quinone oxidoreductase subunit L